MNKRLENVSSEELWAELNKRCGGKLAIMEDDSKDLQLVENGYWAITGGLIGVIVTLMVTILYYVVGG